MEDEDLKDHVFRIEQLKKEKNAVIMAHYYVADEVQAVADYIGDSYYLSEAAVNVHADTIVLCGVSFMGESAKILNPEKTVLLPDASADCPMAHMASVERIAEIRAQYPDVAVVCYVNSTAKLKAASDVCVTSANALKIVKALPNKYIYFIPDQNLARYIAGKLPDKHFIFNDGFCHVHNQITAAEIKAAKDAHPFARVLVHPECRPEVTSMADYVGSTSGIISHVEKCDASEFIIVTETGVFCELRKRCPDRKFYAVDGSQICPNMKKITLDKIIDVLEHQTASVELEQSLLASALSPMERMLQLSGTD